MTPAEHLDCNACHYHPSPSCLGWIMEGASLDNKPIGPSDMRISGMMNISLTTINAGKTMWWDDHPAEHHPFNPKNRHRVVEMLEADPGPKAGPN